MSSPVEVRPLRVEAFVDGFNLYYAIRALKQPHLKWLDLKRLVTMFVAPGSDLRVTYFTAYYNSPQHQDSHRRHILYVSALRSTGVEVVMGRFGLNSNPCWHCGNHSRAEKETDVNMAVRIVSRAGKDFDRGLLISADSDQCPALRAARGLAPDVRFRILFPPGRRGSELPLAAGDRAAHREITPYHLERALLPAQLTGLSGQPIMRPSKYDPPP